MGYPARNFNKLCIDINKIYSCIELWVILLILCKKQYTASTLILPSINWYFIYLSIDSHIIRQISNKITIYIGMPDNLGNPLPQTKTNKTKEHKN